MDDREVSTAFPDPPLPDTDDAGRVVPPWVKYPNLRRGSLGWRMGAGESFLLNVFMPWWREQTESQKERYRDAYPPPDEWIGFYTIPDFDLTGRMVPPWIKYPRKSRLSGTWKISSGKRFLEQFWHWWDHQSDAERDAYRLQYQEPDEWRGFLSSNENA